ncbi:MAG: glycosyltransferase family 2 protein [Syntrophobacteraceae bacterium]
MRRLTYVVITPVRDEADYIGETISSMAGQTILPSRWVIVDDGSSDTTPQILTAAARQYSWIVYVHRPDRGFRKSGGGVIEAFYDGHSAIDRKDFDFLVKLDGDLSFGPDYFEKCFYYFANEPRLGIGGGMICRLDDGQMKEDSAGDPPFHVRGATKIYRRSCWEQICPLIKAPGWDTVDEVKANMLGWTSRTFRDLRLVQHKPTGAADGKWRNLFKNGLANYVTGYHPIFMLAKCVKRTFRKPPFLAAAALWTGFCSGYIKQLPQVEDRQLIRYLRRQQLRRLSGLPSIYTGDGRPV